MTVAEAVTRKLDPSVLLGDWRNTNAEGGIRRIVVERGEGGELSVRAIGAIDWGTVPAHAFAFHFGDIGANVKSGVLVVATFNHFKDDSGRSGYFDREFFHRVAL